MPPPDKPRIVLDPSQPLYVTAVDGRPVTRYRLGGRGGGQPADVIGAVREKREGDDRPRLYFDTARVILIPAEEVAAFRREYERAVNEGDLVQRTAEDFAAHRIAQKERARRLNDSPPDVGEDNAPASPAGGTVS